MADETDPFAKYVKQPDSAVTTPAVPADPFAKYKTPGTEARSGSTIPGTEGRRRLPPRRPPESVSRAAGDVALGVVQGAVDPLIGTGQLVSRGVQALGGPDLSRYVPTSVSGIAEALRQRAESSGYGQAGEFAGEVLPWILMPELRGLSGLGRVFTRSTLPAIAQPVDPRMSNEEFLKAKIVQGALGTGVGEALRGVSRASQSSLDKEAARKAAEDAAKAANETADRIARRNEMNKSLFDFAKRIHGAKGEERQQLIDALNQQHQQQLDQLAADYKAEQARVAGEKTTQADIPNQTALQWHRETLEPIGKAGEAPKSITTDSSAEVRKIVGDELNRIRGGMQLAGPELSRFNTSANAIRRSTSLQVGKAFQDAWRERFKKFVATPLTTPGAMTGKKLTGWISGMNDEAEALALRASRAPESERVPLMAQRDALRKIADGAESILTEGDPALADELANAKRSYMLWSIGQGAGGPEKLGKMIPADLVKTWSGRLGRGPAGDARYLAQMRDPNNPNGRLMRWLDAQTRAHGRDIPSAVRADRPPGPGKPGGAVLPPELRPPEAGDFPTMPVPPRVPSPTLPAETFRERLARHALRGVRHYLAGHFGGPTGLVTSLTASALPPGAIARPLAKTAAAAGRAASAATGAGVSGLWNVLDRHGRWKGMTTNPRYLQPGEQLGEPVQGGNRTP